MLATTAGPLRVAAQTPPPLTPEVIQRLAPESAPRLAPSLQPVIPEATRGPNEAVQVRIEAVRVSGNQALGEAALLPLLQPLVGREVPLADVEQARIAVISAYGQAGYALVTASADLSATGNGYVLHIMVVEGRIDSVKLDGDIGPAGTQVLRFLQRLTDGQAITTGRLERALLLAGDVPGVTVQSVIRPLEGGEAGALELVAKVSRKSVSGYASIDNRGYRLTGPLEGLFAAGTNSFTSAGERIEASLFQTQDWEQSFGQLSGEAFVGGSGLRLRAYAGAGMSRPGSFLAQIGYRGYTEVLGVAAQYPIIRSRPVNLFAGLQFDMLNSEVEQARIKVSRDEVRTLRFGLEASVLDSYWPFTTAAATTAASVRVHQGVNWLGGSWFGRAEDPSLPPGRNQSDFSFVKWTAELSRTQPLFAPGDGMLISLFGLVAGQKTSDVLPLSEKFLFGGNRLGRGFYAGQVTGDTALGFSGEVQLDLRLPSFTVPGASAPIELLPTAQFYLFRDFGRSWENVATDDGRQIESWGGGARVFLSEGLQFDIEGVRRLTRQVDAAGSTVRPLPETAVFFRLLARF